MMKLIAVLFAFTFCTAAAQQFPHPGTHAHNDYEHQRPLFYALQNGFTSFEADIHLADGELLVSHDRPGKNARTLESLYLKPLDSIIAKNGGQIYPKYSHPVMFLIDVKTSGDETFDALQKVLISYRHLLQTPEKKGALLIIVSGNRAIGKITDDPMHLTTIDGRPGDLGKGVSSDLMPMISEAYVRVAGENNDTPGANALKAVRDLAKRVHAENKILRLWAMPDNKAAWKLLRDAGVDVINSDKLNEVHQFLTSSGK